NEPCEMAFHLCAIGGESAEVQQRGGSARRKFTGRRCAELPHEAANEGAQHMRHFVDRYSHHFLPTAPPHLPPLQPNLPGPIPDWAMIATLERRILIAEKQANVV